MSDTVDAIVTRKGGFDHNLEHLEEGAVLPLAYNQFIDWRELGWVGHATPEQVEAAKVAADEKAAAESAAEEATATKAAKGSKTTKSTADKTA